MTGTTINSDGAAAGCIELSFLEGLLAQVKQQTLLEACIVSQARDKINNEWNVVNNNSSTISSAHNQNELITWIACFEYKPYLDETVLSRFMSVKL